MLSAWVPRARPVGAPTLTFSRGIRKQLAKFDIDETRWPELAADRGAWRETLRRGFAPPNFRPQPPPPPPPPPPRPPSRRAAASALAAIDASRANEAALLLALR